MLYDSRFDDEEAMWPRRVPPQLHFPPTQRVHFQIKVTSPGLWSRVSETKHGRLLLVTSLFAWAAVGAFAIYVSGQCDDHACLVPFGGISFDAIVWLTIFATTSLCIIGTLLSCGVAAQYSSNSTFVARIDLVAWRLASLGFIFQLIWFIVGSILYWKQVAPSCTGVFQQGWFAIWVVECVVFSLWFLSGSRVYYRSSATIVV